MSSAMNAMSRGFAASGSVFIAVSQLVNLVTSNVQYILFKRSN